ncbi:MAG: hypothetical protein JWO89_1934 [Verrucomicrobiaceae bacterium]|nr:hypothetical protein [Verrucomicrobiaceae bacterium]
MPSARLQLSTLSHRAAAWLRVSTAVCMLGLTSCDDPKKEAQIRWREEEIAAKEADLASREKALLDQRRAAENLQAQIKQQGEALVAREKALKDNEDKIKQAKVAWETKLRRGPAPSTTCERVAVIDPASDEVYFERNGDKRGAIASTTKIMTALLLAEAGDLDKELTIEEVDTKCAPVRIGLKAGETYTRRDLLTALMVKSSNDIAQALARDNAGSIEAFAEKMNQRAKDLGCKNTLYINPHGLPPLEGQPEPYCTPRDLARIAEEADKRPEIREIVKLKKYDFMLGGKKKIALENTNRVLRTYEYCDGMKTGFTEAAGHCLVATGERDGKRRIVVVLNGNATSVWKDAQALLEWSLKY